MCIWLCFKRAVCFQVLLNEVLFDIRLKRLYLTHMAMRGKHILSERVKIYYIKAHDTRGSSEDVITCHAIIS